MGIYYKIMKMGMTMTIAIIPTMIRALTSPVSSLKYSAAHGWHCNPKVLGEYETTTHDNPVLKCIVQNTWGER